MRIVKFNEKLSTAEVEFAESFKGSLSGDITDYILTVYKETKLPKEEINDIFNSKSIEKYLSVDQDIQKLEKQIENLTKNKDYYELDATSEAVYLLQEKLIFKDFASLYRLYMDRRGSGGFDPDNDEE